MEPKDTILYVPMDFVATDEKAIEFSRSLSDSLVQAQERIRADGLPIKLALKTTVISKDREGWGITNVGKSFFNTGLARLGEAGIDYLVDNWSSGPTRTEYGVLFDQGALARGFAAIATSDLDQFPTQHNLERIAELHDRVMTHNALLGTGARNTPVVLSANRENSYLRRIFEGFINLAISYAAETSGHTLLRQTNEGDTEDKAYSNHGDFVTGVYLFNPSHEKSRAFIDNVVTTSRKRGFFGFEGEYYMAIMAAKFGKVVNIYVNSVSNPFDASDPNNERQNIIQKQIKLPLEKLAKTYAGRIIEKTIKRERTMLADHYSPDQIDEVRELMLEAIE
jgi:hypothetical protein